MGGYVERQRVVVVADAQRIIVRGSGEVVESLRSAYRPVYVGATCRGWTFNRRKRDVDRLPDVVARLQHAGHFVRLIETSHVAEVVETPTPLPAKPVGTMSQPQGSLW